MKKVKFLLLAVVAMVLCSCGVSINDVADQLQDELKTEIAAEKYVMSVEVGEVVLVHEEGNKYTGLVDITVNGEKYVSALNVIFDGENYTCEYERPWAPAEESAPMIIADDPAQEMYSLEEDIRNEIRSQFAQEGMNVYVGEVVLVHEGGNNYRSVVDLSADGETVRCTLRVVYDGDAYTWELEY